LEGETVINLLRLPAVDDKDTNSRLSLGLLTTDGRFKRLPLDEIQELSGRAATILKLKEGVSLLSAAICEQGGTVALVSDIGRILCLPIEEQCLPLMGKLAQGPMTMRMLPGEHLVGAVSQPPNNNSDESKNSGEVLIGTINGGLIRLPLCDLRRCKRGDLGEIAVKLNGDGKETDRLVSVCESADLVGVVTNKGRHARILNTTVSTESDQPTQLMLKGDESLVQLVPLLS
jgi:DNA gyrase subunit A